MTGYQGGSEPSMGDGDGGHIKIGHVAAGKPFTTKYA